MSVSARVLISCLLLFLIIACGKHKQQLKFEEHKIGKSLNCMPIGTMCYCQSTSVYVASYYTFCWEAADFYTRQGEMWK